MKKDKDAIAIVAEAWEKMKNEGCSEYRGGKPNLSELSRRTGFGRTVLRRIMSNGLECKQEHRGKAARKTALDERCSERVLELMRTGITNSSVLYRMAREAGYRGSISSIKRFIARNADVVPAKRHAAENLSGARVRRYETGSGECFQMDWGFVKVETAGGKYAQCACFAMVCHHCGMRYVEFFPNAKQENLFIGMIHAFACMGKPKFVLTDNMASVVTSRDAEGKPIFNATYDDFQRTAGFQTKLCKPRHPWTKGSVERLVKFVKRNMIVGRVFTNITDLNEHALRWCGEENCRMQQGLGLVPSDEHYREELAGLAIDRAIRSFLAPERRITIDGFISYEGRRYGVPYLYAGKTVRVMRSKDRLMIMDREFRIIETHYVDWSKRPHYSSAQFEPMVPEELPTAPVTDCVTLSLLKGELDKYDF